MIKRNQAKQTRSDKKRSTRLNKRRRLNMEGLEDRRLLAVMTDLPSSPAPELTEYTLNRNVGTVQSFTFNESENVLETGLNDSTYNADIVPIGTGFGQRDTVDVFGFLPVRAAQTQTGLTADMDTFGMELRGGDILDIAVLGAATQYIVRDATNLVVFGSNSVLGDQFPRQTVGNATGIWVVPRDGTYYLTVALDTPGGVGGYTVGLRAYRPLTEELAVGDAQIIYLDFNGDVIDGNLLGAPGFIRIPSLLESLPLMGLEIGDVEAADAIIDNVIDQTIRVFEDLTETGENGDYTETSSPGQYAVRILNSRDHVGQIALNDPRITRMFVGGDDTVIPPYGIAQTVDLGNFDLSQVAFAQVSAASADAADADISPNRSEVDFVGHFLGNLVAHEVGHVIGMAHTDGENLIDTVSDEGAANSLLFMQGLGPDGIFGTSDDTEAVFADDFYSVQPGEFGYIGLSEITNTLAHLMSTGTVGGGVSGRVFFDENLDGSGSGDGGLSGVSVFADTNDNGIYNTGEPTAITGTSGVFSLSVAPGQVDIYALTPENYIATTSSVVSVNVPNSGTASGVDFGFGIVSGIKTGIAFDDLDGNGVQGFGESALEGIYIYLDADGDNRPDLGELSTTTSDDGSYHFNFPAAGNYVIRAVAAPGYQVSSPASGEYNIYYDGVAASNEYNFGFRSTLDFADAPASYGTTLPDGARHGIVDGLAIGSAPDRDVNGIPSIDADGDDNNQAVNDEDGILQTTPLAPGATANFSVTVTNTTGSTAYLQAFIDLNQNGNYNDAGEQFVTDRVVNSGLTNVIFDVTADVPANAATGSTYARFRLSKTGGLGATGFAGTGEVQDHRVMILSGSEIANDDYFEIARNSVSVPLDVLANDFQLSGNTLTIDSLNTVGTKGIIPPPTNNQILYTPPNGFIGADAFSYTVVDQFGNQATASVVINVKFQSNVPIALDDIYSVPKNSVGRPLAVLNNDVASINDGLWITSTTAGTQGGTIMPVSGGQSIRYTPPAGFGGTEQFGYTIQDGLGLVSQATVTVNMLPDSLNDDLAEFTVEVLDATNGDPIDHVQVGDEFVVRVSVDDLRPGVPNGVVSAFLDLLYTAALVSTVDSDPNDAFDFDVAFGPLFSGGSTFKLGDALTPGLLNEVGSTQDFNNLTEHMGPALLFEVTMRANAAGIAQFMGDPSNTTAAETVLKDDDHALDVEELRFGATELRILPTSDFVTAAVDDSFPDGLDSEGNVIVNGSAQRSRLYVLDNDNLGITDSITEFGLLTGPAKGIVLVENNGTPSDLQDDYLSYRPNFGQSGLESFSYFVVTSEGVMTSADVTIALGSQNIDARVAFDFSLVDRAGDPVNPSEVTVGDEIGLRVTADDLVDQFSSGTLVYAGFLDVLYDADLLTPVDPVSGNYNFDLEFGSEFSEPSGSGTAAVPGIIDEIGSLRSNTSFNFPYTNDDPATLVTIYFDVNSAGTARFVGSPANLLPQHDTLVFLDDDPVAIDLIRHDVLTITVSAAGSQQQNQNDNEDVNGDGFVSPIDALIVINDLATLGEGESSGSGSGDGYYPDVNGDFKVTAQDAALVLRRLALNNNSNNGGSGEQVAPVWEVEDRLVSGSTDAVFADLGIGDLSSTDKIAITDCPKAPDEVLAPSTTDSDTDTRDDDENDVLNLLAGDVDGIWA